MVESSFTCLPSPLSGARLQSLFGLGLVFGSLVVAIFVAPESPDQLASICERHNSVIACRVL